MSPDELVARAAAMRDTLRARQAECESLGRLPDATNDEYIQAGFFRVLQPRRFGGYELGLEAFLRIAIELSRGCPSSGWVYALTAGHAHTVTMWPEQGQVDLFGDGDFRCPLSNLPAQAVAVDGGFRVDGWWDYGSGCDTATHFIGGVGVVDAPGGEIVDTRWAAFPRDAYRIVDNWDTLGMRGTGIEILQTRHQYGPASPLRRELSMFQRDLGRATALVDTAEAALMQVAATWTRQAHDVVERGIPITDEMQRRLLMICQQNVELSPRTAICPRPAAPDRHGPERSVAPPLSPSGPRRPASTVHGHLAARAMECAV